MLDIPSVIYHCVVTPVLSDDLIVADVLPSGLCLMLGDAVAVLADREVGPEEILMVAAARNETPVSVPGTEEARHILLLHLSVSKDTAVLVRLLSYTV